MTSPIVSIPVHASAFSATRAGVESSTSVDARIAQLRKQTENKPRPSAIADCQQEPWVGLFFDGTGNNYDADLKTRKHSNVGRLFEAYPDVDPTKGLYRIYIPGLGTYNRDISDSGEGMAGLTGNAVANRGEDRLKQAHEKLDEIIKRVAALAKNPVNKIRMIHLALFGFSRGAALARAFAHRLQSKYCEPDGQGGWRTKDGRHPIEIYFMGLFDSVASVGVPASAKNMLRDARAGFNNPVMSVTPAGIMQKTAFNALDVFLSQADGHIAWGGDMRIPDKSFVKHCEHMIAVHEYRNSFPLDLVLDNGSYPVNCRESVYPGAHSDVGGGYRPGEGGKCEKECELLSLIPLREMHKIAISKGVPFQKLENLRDMVLQSFTLDPTLARRYKHYMQHAGFGGLPVNVLFLSHMKWYFRWRIIRVGRMLAAEKAEVLTEEEQKLARIDANVVRQNVQLEKERAQADKEREEARNAYMHAVREVYRDGPLPDHVKRRNETETSWKSKEDAYYRKNQELSQQPSVGKIAKRLKKYDKEFMEDSQRILKMDRAKLTPYQRIIYDAWKEPALTDPEIIAFFDMYVHDSHAGFGLDNTHAIDPRILYQGGDKRMDLVQSEPERMRA